jgi:hypothetical protein
VSSLSKLTKKKRKRRQQPANSEISSADFAAEQHYPLWEAMRARLCRPKSLKRLAKGQSVHPLLWGIESTSDAFDPGFAYWTASTVGDFRLNRLVDRNGQAKQQSAGANAAWLSAFSEQFGTTLDALECLAAAHTLAQRRQPIVASIWERCLSRLATIAGEAQSMHALHDAWEAQLFAAELPITLAYLFRPCGSMRQFGPLGVAFLEESLDRLVEDDGLLTEAPVERVMPLLACWTRCLLMIAASADLKLCKSARCKYTAFVLYILRLLDGQLAVPFEPPLGKVAKTARRAMLHVLPQLIRSKQARRLVREAVSKGGMRSARTRKMRMLVGDDGSSALLQSDWRSSRGRLFVDFSHAVHRIHLFCDSETILSGQWHPTVSLSGCQLETRSTWKVLFSYSDQDVDLVELESELGGQWRLQRHFLLAKKDAFVYFADLVYGPTEEPIDYYLPIPLRGEGTFAGAEETRECCWRSSSSTVRLIPLAATEWRSQRSPCQLDTVPPALSVRRADSAGRLYAPLFIDLDQRRRKKELTWRQLAVAENLRRVADNTAVGYRVQLGSEQWLIYRSFTRFGNRTVLGQNLSSEFFCGRFLPDGTTEMLIEVELDPKANHETVAEGANARSG